MSTTTYSHHTALSKKLLKGLLPEKVIERITMVSEDYMLDRNVSALRVRFGPNVWSIPLLLADKDLMEHHKYEAYVDRSLNRDEFIVNCLMICEAGVAVDA